MWSSLTRSRSVIRVVIATHWEREIKRNLVFAKYCSEDARREVWADKRDRTDGGGRKKDYYYRPVVQVLDSAAEWSNTTGQCSDILGCLRNELRPTWWRITNRRLIVVAADYSMVDVRFDVRRLNERFRHWEHWCSDLQIAGRHARDVACCLIPFSDAIDDHWCFNTDAPTYSNEKMKKMMNCTIKSGC